MITRFSATICVALLFLSLEESACYNPRETPKLSEFRLKLHQKLTTPAASPETEMKVTRVVYPAEYGGDPSGKEESSEAFEKALEEAFSVADGNEEMVRGVKHLGGVVVIDLEGGSYRIGKPFRFLPPVVAIVWVVPFSLSVCNSVHLFQVL